LDCRCWFRCLWKWTCTRYTTLYQSKYNIMNKNPSNLFVCLFVCLLTMLFWSTRACGVSKYGVGSTHRFCHERDTNQNGNARSWEYPRSTSWSKTSFLCQSRSVDSTFDN
jgi:hypothetical protein